MTQQLIFNARDLFPYVEPDQVTPVIVAEVKTMLHTTVLRLNTSLEADATVVSE